MKKFLLAGIILSLIFLVLFSGCGGGNSGTPTPAPTSTPCPTVGPGSYVIHYDGDPVTGCGANTFAECLVHFNATKLQSYVGCNLVGIEIFFYNDGTPMTLNYTAEIFNGVGETVSSPGNLLYSNLETVTRGSWNQVNLNSPIPITSGMEIWAGFSISCPSAWPISIDNLPEVSKTSYFKNGTTGSFGELTTNLDIRLMVQKN